MLKKLWFGNYSLARTFWIFYIVGVPVMFVVTAIVAVPLGMAGLKPVAYPVGFVIFWGYWLIASVGVWRSADAYGLTKWWPNLAKCVVVLLSAIVVYRLIDGGADRIVQLITA